MITGNQFIDAVIEFPAESEMKVLEVFRAVQQQNLDSASPSEAAVAALAQILPSPKE